jgi:23S rRNA pseudouridine1911/1915/1917 synthase
VAPAEAGRLDRFLASSLPELSRTRLSSLIRDGRVLVDGSTARPSLKLKGGERIQIVVPKPTSTTLEPEDIPLALLYEDADLVVVLKPAGMVVHPARGNWSGTLVHALLHAVPDLATGGGDAGLRPGIVHRLDKGTSGVLVIARHDLALRRLQARFMIHAVIRRYLAVVHGTPARSHGRIASQIGRDLRNRLRFASTSVGGRSAATNWSLVASNAGFSLVVCQLETGRTHQVRVHLSEMGHPVVGDTLYGSPRKAPAGLLEVWPDHPLLHAAHLAFDHPIHGRRLTFDADPPDDFRRFCDVAGLAIPTDLRAPESAPREAP